MKLRSPLSHRCSMAGLSLVLALFLFLAGIVSLRLVVRSIPRQKIPGASVIYLPSGKYLKTITFGFPSLAADLIYLWAIQYYSTRTIVDRYQYLEHIFSVIAELDPKYQDPYEVGALIAIYEARNLELGLKILDLGLAKNPNQWIFPFQAGHYAQMARDFDLARRYYEKTMKIPGAPDIAKRLYAAASFKMMDLQTAWETWQEIHDTATDPRVKEIAIRHLYRVKAAMDIRILEETIAQFKQRFGRNPTHLEELVQFRLLSSLPKDLDGDDYLYDPEKGEVGPPKIWWKK